MSKETHFLGVCMTSDNLVLEKVLRYGARVALVGMGKTNLGLLRFFAQWRRDLVITMRDRVAFACPTDLPFLSPVKTVVGDGYLCDLTEEVLFLAPTVRVDSEPIQRAIRLGASVCSDVSCFLENTKSVCFGVTGSDGKSTTVSLSQAILEEGNVLSRVGGNIGKVLLPYLALERSGDCTVVELSSFQLQLPVSNIQRGLITNLTPNHLDFHSSLEEYYNAKLSLLFSAKEPVLGCDDEEIVCRCVSLSPYVSYSMGERYDRRAEHIYTVREGVVFLDGVAYLSLSGFSHRGRTFLKNVVASLALTHGYHTPESAKRAISFFRPLAHRREFVCEENGVLYYNCSADSTPSRTVETLSTFSSPVLLVMGGRSKGVDYSILCDGLRERVKYVLLCGENSEEIAVAIAPSGVAYEILHSLSDAVGRAKALCVVGDTVVFSPGSTSFDSYKNFEERGEAFSLLVKRK